MRRGRQKDGLISSDAFKFFNTFELHAHISLVHETFLSFYVSKRKSMMLSLSYLLTIPRMTFQKFVSRIFLIVMYIKFGLGEEEGRKSQYDLPRLGIY